MTPDFWRERWQSNQIGFHEGKPNTDLVAHWPSLGLPHGSRVFVPLCGKSVDMGWLAGEGHSVLGVELSDIAVRDFFAEAGLTPTRESRDGFEISKAGAIEIWCGDFFKLQPRQLADVAAVYDRASLIAMPPAMRPAYAARMIELIPPTAPTLLISLEYDQREISGPPFSVSLDEVQALYEAAYTITEIGRHDALASLPHVRTRGLTKAENLVLRLTRRTTA